MTDSVPSKDLSELYQWLIDKANDSDPYDSQMFTKAMTIVGDRLAPEPAAVQLVRLTCLDCQQPFDGHPGDNACKTCWEKFGGMTVEELTGGIPFQAMEASTEPLTHMEILSAVHHHASEIVRLTAAVPVECSPQPPRDECPENNCGLPGCPACFPPRDGQ